VIRLVGKHHLIVVMSCASVCVMEFNLRSKGDTARRNGKMRITLPPLGSMCISFMPGMGVASWQVFGLAGSYAPASQFMAEPVLVEAFVPAYRCGAVPDFHRIPF
jgi:hypothetical protein